MPSRSVRRWYFAVFALLGLAACGLGPAVQASKVIVDQWPTDVVFGATNPAVAAKLPQLPSGLPQPEPSLFLGNSFPYVFLGGGQTACGVAPPTGAPAQPATTQVNSKPRIGEYRWIASGKYEQAVGANVYKLPISAYQYQDVRRVTPVPDDFPELPGSSPSLNFTYQTVERNLVGGLSLVYTWQVKSQPQTGDPEGGLSLMEIDAYNGAGQQVDRLFAGKPALLILPLPVSPGTIGYQGPNGGIAPTTSVDSSSHANNMQWNAKVVGRERIDACGTWIQAWALEGALTNGSNKVQLHLDVATQLGALIVGMNFDGNFLGLPLDKVVTHYGQTTPAPLPARWR